jgi:signal transduction histidine kinase
MAVRKGRAKLLAQNGLSAEEITRRKAFLELRLDDVQRLEALAPLARRYADEVIEELYKHFLAFQESRKFFPDQAMLNQVKRLQKRYFLRLTSGRYDDAYIADRVTVGAVHERIGLAVKTYLGAYRRYLDLVARRLRAAFADNPDQAFNAFMSLLKVVFLDIGLAIDTYISQRERTIQRQNQELTEQNRRVQEANRLKSEFLANMSHELRTPLNAIIGFTELMHDARLGPIAANQKAFLADTLANARHLLSLINDVLDLAKAESGTMTFHPEPVDIGALMREARHTFGQPAAHRQIHLRTRSAIGTAQPLVDRSRLKQVLFNYLSNAIKFTGDGGRITARVRRDGKELVIEVKDTGIGISAEDIPRLFSQFQQLDGGSSKRYPGTGLGLAITRQIVEQQGGEVGVHSTLGKGSTFYARIPLIQKSAPARVSPQSSADRPDLNGRRVANGKPALSNSRKGKPPDHSYLASEL